MALSYHDKNILKFKKMPYDIVRYTYSFIPQQKCNYCNKAYIYFPSKYPPLIVCDNYYCTSLYITYHISILSKIIIYPFYVFIRPFAWVFLYALAMLFYIFHFTAVVFLLSLYYILYLSISTSIYVFLGRAYPIFPPIVPIMPFLYPPSAYLYPFIPNPY